MEQEEKKALFQKMLEQEGDRLLRMCTLYLKDGNLAEDAVQDSFEKLLKYLPEIDAPDSPKTQKLVLKIVRNTAIDQ